MGAIGQLSGVPVYLDWIYIAIVILSILESETTTFLFHQSSRAYRAAKQTAYLYGDKFSFLSNAQLLSVEFFIVCCF